MGRYEPIEPIDAEAAARSMKDADRLRRRWDDLRAAAGEDRVRVALDGERWRAAVETGVIERLYEVSEGVTEAIVRSGLEADEALRLDAEVYDQIAAHRHAETVVVDAVRQGRELTTSLIRELHAAVTHAQSHYTAYDQFGRAFRRELAHGHYKDHDNHVTLPDGTVHEYAPATQVDSEMDRLVGLIGESADEYPVRLAAFAHHRFTQVHPFADGNGRTARLLSSLLLVRGGYLPLVVTRDDREEYLRALREADETTLLGLVDFFVRLQQSALNRTEALTLASVSGLHVLSDALARLAEERVGAVTKHRDIEREIVTPLTEVLDSIVGHGVEEMLEPFRRRGFAVETAVSPRQLVVDGRPSDQAAEANYIPAPQGRCGQVARSFRVGALEERRTRFSVVPLARASAVGDAVLVVSDDEPGTFRPLALPPLPVSSQDPNEREIRRWVEDALGRMLVDYAQRL